MVDLGLPVGVRHALQLKVEQLSDEVPLTVLSVDAPRSVQRAQATLIGLERCLVADHRALLVAELLLKHFAQGVDQGGPLIDRLDALHLGLTDLHPSRPILETGEQCPHVLKRAARLRIGLNRRAVDLDRAPRVVQHRLRDLTRHLEALDCVRGVRRILREVNLQVDE